MPCRILHRILPTDIRLDDSFDEARIQSLPYRERSVGPRKAGSDKEHRSWLQQCMEQGIEAPSQFPIAMDRSFPGVWWPVRGRRLFQGWKRHLSVHPTPASSPLDCLGRLLLSDRGHGTHSATHHQGRSHCAGHVFLCCLPDYHDCKSPRVILASSASHIFFSTNTSSGPSRPACVSREVLRRQSIGSR